jgi:glycosyltransferase involved in cell wall biosynthesis
MNVGFCIRGDVARRPGGDYVQFKETANALRDLGIVVKEYLGEIPDSREMDVLHVFNTSRISYPARVAKYSMASGVPMVLTPIWHSTDQMQKFYRKMYRLESMSVSRYLGAKELFYEFPNIDFAAIRSCISWIKTVRTIARSASAVVANSDQELSTFCEELEILVEPNASIVPNAFNLKEISRLSKGVEKEKRIVCAGRVEPRKNQIAVAKAFLNSELASTHDLVFIGELNNWHKKYVSEFEKLLKQNASKIRYLGSLQWQDAVSLYSSSEIAVLASFFETTGLSALEALACKAKVVMTQASYNDYYFGSSVEYCDPYDVNSITDAMNKTSNTEYPARDLSKFTWQHVGELLVKVYERILD